MKKVYSLVLGLGLCITAVNAQQYDMEMRLTSPASGSSKAPVVVEVSYEIENVGDADVEADKVVWLTYLIGQDNFGWDGTAGLIDGLQSPAAVTPGTVITSAMLSTALYSGTALEFDASAVAAVTPACAWIIGVTDADATTADLQALAQNGDPNDADNDNNIDCFSINPALASIVEMSVTDAVDVKVLTESLEVSSLSLDAYDYIIYSLNGKTMDQGQIKGNTTISTSTFENGAYVIYIHNNTEKKVVKFAVAK